MLSARKIWRFVENSTCFVVPFLVDGGERRTRGRSQGLILHSLGSCRVLIGHVVLISRFGLAFSISTCCLWTRLWNIPSYRRLRLISIKPRSVSLLVPPLYALGRHWFVRVDFSFQTCQCQRGLRYHAHAHGNFSTMGLLIYLIMQVKVLVADSLRFEFPVSRSLFRIPICPTSFCRKPVRQSACHRQSVSTGTKQRNPGLESSSLHWGPLLVSRNSPLRSKAMEPLPDSVIILLVILGAAFSVCIGFGMQRLFTKEQPTNWNQKSQSQLEYQREVRERGKMQAWDEARAGRRHHPEGYRVSH